MTRTVYSRPKHVSFDAFHSADAWHTRTPACSSAFCWLGLYWVETFCSSLCKNPRCIDPRGSPLGSLKAAVLARAYQLLEEGTDQPFLALVVLIMGTFLANMEITVTGIQVVHRALDSQVEPQDRVEVCQASYSWVMRWHATSRHLRASEPSRVWGTPFDT